MRRSPLEPEAYDCVAIVTNHSGIDYADLVRRSKVVVDFRNATKGHEVDGKVWKLVMARVGVAGLGYWGPNLARNFDDLAELAWLCDLDGEHRDRFAARYPARADDGELRRDARRRHARRRRGRDAGADALRAREAGARGRQARPRREAAGDASRRDGRARRARCRADRVSDAGPPPPLPPRRRQAEGADLERTSSARSSASTATARTSGSCARTRTRSGRSACTTCR